MAGEVAMAVCIWANVSGKGFWISDFGFRISAFGTTALV
jgi:hypothetical protein